MAASANLWDLDGGLVKANRYSINPTAAGLVVTLPAIGTADFNAGTGAGHGYHVWIRNISGTEALQINNSVAALIDNINPGESVLLTASEIISSWYILSKSSSAGSAVQTLQETYDASPSQPKILTDATNESVSIQLGHTTVGNIFNVSGRLGESLVTVKNNDGATNYNLELLQGSVDAASRSSVAIGAGASIINGENVVMMTGNASIESNTENAIKIESFENGFLQTKAGIREGTLNSDPGCFTNYFTLNDVADTGESIIVMQAQPLTSYSFECKTVAKQHNTGEGEGSYFIAIITDTGSPGSPNFVMTQDNIIYRNSTNPSEQNGELFINTGIDDDGFVELTFVPQNLTFDLRIKIKYMYLTREL